MEAMMATEPNQSKILSAGTPAPDFELPSSPEKKLKLRELRGRPVILVFYPADWSPVCGDQTTLYNEILPDFREYGADLLGISVDGPWCHAAFAREAYGEAGPAFEAAAGGYRRFEEAAREAQLREREAAGQPQNPFGAGRFPDQEYMADAPARCC